MISLLRFLAMLMITNSHFGSLYPEGMSILATGGTIGNSIFMFCSGFTLYSSVISLNKDESLIANIKIAYNWLAKRVFRIFPSVWLFRIFGFLFLGSSLKLISFVVPGYWFLNAILVFYVFFYIVVYSFEKHLNKLIILLILPFLFVFLSQSNFDSEFIIEQTGNQNKLHWYYYFAIMLFGALVNKNKAKWVKVNIWGGVKALVAIGAYYAFKALIIRYGLFSMQFLVPFLLFPIMIFFTEFSEFIISRSNYNKIESIVKSLSNLTLDVYIVQFIIISYASKYIFPIGWIGAWIVILVGGGVLYYASKVINRFIIKYILIK